MSKFRPKRPANGWWPAADLPDAHINDELLVDGESVACVMCFHEDAPVYGVASLPEGPTVRSGAIDTLAAARDWCERMAGLKPRTLADASYVPKN